MFILISDIVRATERSRRNFRTIQEIEFLPNEGFFSGNNAVVFPVIYKGKRCAMRCYMRSRAHLAAIYGDQYFAQEMMIEDKGEIDVVISPWVEGRTLSKVVEEADQTTLLKLSDSFNHLAASIIEQKWAHGDLSGDNIIVGDDMSLSLIDFDSKYLPELSGENSLDLGNRSYQSPLRDRLLFDSRMDDFSIAIISVSLRALSLDPTLRARYKVLDSLLLDGSRVQSECYPLLSEVIELLAESGEAATYQMAKIIRSGATKIDSLPAWLRHLTGKTAQLESPDLVIHHGISGYNDLTDPINSTPPLYDLAFDFRGEYALVSLMKRWFYIDRNCNIVESMGLWERGNPPVRRK